MNKALLVLIVLMGLAWFSMPLQAQTALPVQVVCTTGPGTYKPICGDVKQAVKGSSLYKPAKNGNRYVVLLYAKTCETAAPGGGPGCSRGDVVVSVTFEVIISDLLSHSFPYHIASVPWVLSPSESRVLAEAVVQAGLPVAVLTFSAVVDEINSHGISERQLGEAAVDEILKQMKLEMNRFLKEQTK